MQTQVAPKPSNNGRTKQARKTPERPLSAPSVERSELSDELSHAIRKMESIVSESAALLVVISGKLFHAQRELNDLEGVSFDEHLAGGLDLLAHKSANLLIEDYNRIHRAAFRPQR